MPETPNADEVDADGLELDKMNALLLKKIEELTLYIIALDDQLIDQAETIQKLQSDVELIKDMLVKK